MQVLEDHLDINDQFEPSTFGLLLSKADKTLLGILKEFGRFLVRVVAPDMPKQLLR